jgi:hypothetical protein
MSDRRGHQWVIDPAGHRWKVVGFNPIVAFLDDEEGVQINVGRSILQQGFACGAWKMAEFEEIDTEEDLTSSAP